MFADIDPRTLNLDPQAAAAAITDRTAALLPVHIFGYPADIPALERTACRSSRTPARRSARCTPTASPVGGRGHPAAFGFYANKQLTTGEGGMLTLGSDAHKVTIDSERNQGRAPDMGWLDHDRLGFNYRLSDIACAIGLAQLERLDDMLAARARVADCYREALARARRRARASSCPARTRAATAAAGSCSWSSSRAGSTATPRSSRCASSACRASPTCPPST